MAVALSARACARATKSGDSEPGPQLMDKTGYKVHYRALRLYLELGLIPKKVHRVLSFRQRAWLAPFIQMNTNLRKAAKNEFEKSLYKLVNNSVFGKTMENLRNRIDIQCFRPQTL